MEIILAAALLPAIILMIYVYKQSTVYKGLHRVGI